MVPLKMREPVGRHDGASGYVNCLAVEEVGPAGVPGRCRLSLRGNHNLECLYAEQTARKRLKAGKIMRDHLQMEMEQALSAGGKGPDLPREWWMLLESLIKAMLASRDHP